MNSDIFSNVGKIMHVVNKVMHSVVDWVSGASLRIGIFVLWSTNCLKSCNSHGPDTLFISRRKKNQTSLIWTTGWRLRFLKMKSTGHLCSRSPAKKQMVNTRANPKKSQVVRSSLWIIFGQKKLFRSVQHRTCPGNWKWSISVAFAMD